MTLWFAQCFRPEEGYTAEDVGDHARLSPDAAGQNAGLAYRCLAP